MKRSTGLRNHLLAVGSLRSALDGCVINIYSGPEPATADAALSGNTLLCTITRDGDGVTGLTLAADAASGQITKNPLEVWEGSIVASGTATFFRQEYLSDAGAATTTAVRLQGSVDTVGADMNFSDTVFVVGDSRRINFYVASIPAV